MTAANRTSYHDVKAHILKTIRDNIWPPGTLLPGEIELAETLGCARATVNRAMRELAEEGILERKRKAGTRVKQSPTRQAKLVIPLVREEIARTGAHYRYALIGREIITAARRLSAEYSFPVGQDVLHLECMHYANDEPFQYEERWINLAAVPTARDADFSVIGPNDWLVQEVPFTDAVISFRAVRPTREVADLLGSNESEAHFQSERTTRLHGETVTLARLIFHFGYQVTSKI